MADPFLFHHHHYHQDLHVLLGALEGGAVGPGVIAGSSTRIIELDRRSVHGIGYRNEQAEIINNNKKEEEFSSSSSSKSISFI
jgi:hypothetical protein